MSRILIVAVLAAAFASVSTARTLTELRATQHHALDRLPAANATTWGSANASDPFHLEFAVAPGVRHCSATFCGFSVSDINHAIGYNSTTMVSQNYTISLWLNTNTTQPTASTIACIFSDHARPPFDIRVHTLMFNAANYITPPGTATLTIPLDGVDAWHHYVFTYNSSVVAVYLDGVSLGATPSGEMPYTEYHGSFSIGMDYDSTLAQFGWSTNNVCTAPNQWQTVAAISTYATWFTEAEAALLYTAESATNAPTAAPTTAPVSTATPTTATPTTATPTTATSGITDPVNITTSATADSAPVYISPVDTAANRTTLTVRLNGTAVVTVAPYNATAAPICTALSPLNMRATPVVRFQLTTDTTTAAALPSTPLAVTLNTPGVLDPQRRLYACINDTWVLSTTTCTGSVEAFVSEWYTNETMTTLVCHMTPFALFSSTLEYIEDGDECPSGKWGCFCDATSRWRSGNAFLSLLLVGGVLAFVCEQVARIGDDLEHNSATRIEATGYNLLDGARSGEGGQRQPRCCCCCCSASCCAHMTACCERGFGSLVCHGKDNTNKCLPPPRWWRVLSAIGLVLVAIAVALRPDAYTYRVGNTALTAITGCLAGVCLLIALVGATKRATTATLLIPYAAVQIAMYTLFVASHLTGYTAAWVLATGLVALFTQVIIMAYGGPAAMFQIAEILFALACDILAIVTLAYVACYDRNGSGGPLWA